MTARTVEEHVSSLLSQSVAGTKSARTPSTALESSAIFGSVAMSLMLKPRTALYFEYLAKNALSKAVQTELDLLSVLSSMVHDLGNVSYKIEGSPSLTQARSALIQLEALPRISPDSPPLSLFERSVQQFLDKHLSRNVRRRGVGDLVRPSAEALADLPSALNEVKTQHAAMLDRLYTLVVGIENFMSAPFAAILGTAAISKARSDLEEILAQVVANGDPSASRDYAVRLISSKATISTIAKPPGIFDPVMPEGTIATSLPVAPEATSAAGPFSLAPNATFTIDGVSTTFFSSSSELLFSTDITFPLTVGGHLFLAVSGAAPKAISLAGTFTNASGLAAAITAAAASVDPSFVASWYPGGLPKLILSHSSAEFFFAPSAYVDDPRSTTGSQKLLTDSLHAELSIPLGERSHGLLTAGEIAGMLTQVFPTYGFVENSDASLTVTSPSTAPGTELQLLFPTSFELSGTYRASSDGITLGVSDHTAYVQTGDLVDDYVVKEVTAEVVTLSAAVPTFTKAVSIHSPLVLSHRPFLSNLKKFLTVWTSSSFAKDLSALDRAMAPLLASQSPAQRADAMAMVNGLVTRLTSLLNVLNDPSTMLQPGAAQEERKTVDGILSTLGERNYDRAADRLLMCDLQSLLEADEDSASYAGSFLRASSTFAQSGGVDQTVDVDSDTAVSAGA